MKVFRPMNPRKLLSRLADAVALPATLTRRDGSTLSLRVRPETATVAESLDPARGGRAVPLPVRSWSAAIDAFSDVDLREFERFATLSVVGDDGVERSFPVARDSASGRLWRWRYATPGSRIVFFTSTSGDRSRPREFGFTAPVGR
ncbi:MAG: hypothetical protein IJ991_10170 [Thermoguttaceae bacterium]|nr:hypothetical protein [Thermoguttaceae bacterium]